MKHVKNGRLSNRNRRDPNGTILGVFLSENGRLPAFAQRRLDDLIEKKRETGLTRDESRELRAALDYVEQKSIELLAHAASLQAMKRTSPATEPRPLWQQYLESRWRKLLAR
jgi:hypothetical protein